MILRRMCYDSRKENKSRSGKMEQYNILIVEDDKEIRDGIEIFLKSQNYNVFKAADGVEGREALGCHAAFYLCCVGRC